VKKVLKIEGMHCDGCAERVERVLGREPGVRRVGVEYESGEGTVDFNEQAVKLERLLELVEQAGYRAEPA
jgi:copper chaperone